jgi:transposase-like protein
MGYSAERKEAILRQMMPPTNKPIAELVREHGISGKTLYAWRSGVCQATCRVTPKKTS